MTPARVLLLWILPACCAAHLQGAASGGTDKPRGPVYGCRLPRTFFVVTGFGQTDEGSGIDPFETGAHDLAMEDAGIENFNLVEYTSIIPREAREVLLDEARKHPAWRHGAVLECIMSEVHGARGDRVTAGVGRMMVHRAGDKGAVLGGFATEYKGHAAPELAEKELRDALEELFQRRFSPRDDEMGDKQYALISRVVERAFGTVMAGVCFLDYIHPLIEEAHSEL